MMILELLEKAHQYHQSNQFKLAEGFYSKALELVPDHLDAMLGLGTLLAQTKNFVEATSLLQKAIQLAPDCIEGSINLAGIYQQQGNFTAAIEIYQQLIEQDPDYAMTYLLLGELQSRQRKLDEAEACFMNFLKLSPRHAPAWNNLANLYLNQSRWNDAEQAFQKALSIEPTNVTILFNQANAFKQQGKFQDALQIYHVILKLEPRHLGALCHVSLAMNSLGQKGSLLYLELAGRYFPQEPLPWLIMGDLYLEQESIALAERAYQEALKRDQHSVAAWVNLSVIKQQLGEFKLAETYLAKAFAIHPQDLDLGLQLASLMMLNDQKQDAKNLYLNLRERFPNAAVPLVSLAQIALQEANFEQARQYYLLALEQAPSPLVWFHWGNYLQSLGACRDAIDAYQQALSYPLTKLQRSRVLSAQIISQYCLSEISNHNLIDSIKNLSKQMIIPAELSPVFSHVRQSSKIRIAYVTPDAFQHVAGMLLSQLLTYHNHHDFEIHVFALMGRSDALTIKLQALADQWHWLDTENMQANKKLIRHLKIDVLFDMAGLSSRSLLTLFDEKLATVQITGLGLPLPTGLDSFNGFATDRVCFENGLIAAGQGVFSELNQLFELPSWICWEYTKEQIQVDRDIENSSIVFGSAHNLTKLNDDLLRVWACILECNSQWKLILKTSGVKDIHVLAALQKPFENLVPGQVTFEDTDNYHNYLRFYNRVDFILDSFPYPGGTTTCEALWMGVPVISLPIRHYGGASLLLQAGHPDWIAKDKPSYISLAQNLAQQGPWNRQQRLDLRYSFEQTPAFRVRDYVAQLERQCKIMLQQKITS